MKLFIISISLFMLNSFTQDNGTFTNNIERKIVESVENKVEEDKKEESLLDKAGEKIATFFLTDSKARTYLSKLYPQNWKWLDKSEKEKITKEVQELTPEELDEIKEQLDRIHNGYFKGYDQVW